MNRRHLLKSAAAAGTIAAIGPWKAWAAERPLTFVSWGGALSDMETTAFIKPFSEKIGKELVSTSPTKYAKIKAMVESANVEWDLVTVGGRFAYDGSDDGLLEELDYARIPNAQALPEGFRGPYGVVTSVGATIMAWNTDKIKDGPQSWADFWDVKKFPGPRGLYKLMYYNYEATMLAAGVAMNEIYPVTDEKVEQMFAKLAELKPHISVWWDSGAQPGQLLSSGELAMSSAWDGRIKAVKKENAPVDFTYRDGIAWGNVVVVPKGTPYKDMVMDLINYSLSLEAQTVVAKSGVYAPALSAAAAQASEEVRKTYASAPENMEHMLVLNEQQAAMYMKKYTTRWQEFQLG
jgi:putative spermidine/putrescine transport system substrate-binding protein